VAEKKSGHAAKRSKEFPTAARATSRFQGMIIHCHIDSWLTYKCHTDFTFDEIHFFLEQYAKDPRLSFNGDVFSGEISISSLRKFRFRASFKASFSWDIFVFRKGISFLSVIFDQEKVCGTTEYNLEYLSAQTTQAGPSQARIVVELLPNTA